MHLHRQGEAQSDSGSGGYNVGWTSAGEWLEYSINALFDGQYTLQIRTASSGAAGNFHVEFDGVNKTGTNELRIACTTKSAVLRTPIFFMMEAR